MNLISKLMKKEFCLMVINKQKLFTTPTIETWDAYLKKTKKNKLVPLKRYIKKGYIVILEVDNHRCFVFTNLPKSYIFKNFQRIFKNTINYVFCGNNTGGYFKILENGLVKRKIASFLKMGNTVEYPDILREPCDYELKTNKIYKLNPNAIYMTEQLENFTRKEILELFHYYIGDENLMNVKNIILYSLKWK